MTQRRRSSADRDFRESILARARSYALANGLDPQRVQQRIAFERLLARLAGADGWVLKGGFALEMRYGWRNRPTKDLDLQSESPPDVSLDQLKALSGDLQTGDHFTFELLESTRELQGAPGAGIRVRVVARVAGTILPDSMSISSPAMSLRSIPTNGRGWIRLPCQDSNRSEFQSIPSRSIWRKSFMRTRYRENIRIRGQRI
jgi:hypothetical protein